MIQSVEKKGEGGLPGAENMAEGRRDQGFSSPLIKKPLPCGYRPQGFFKIIKSLKG